MDKDRRETLRRIDDKESTCLFHMHGEVKVATLEETVKRMDMKLNIGVGLVLAATLVVGVLFYSLDKVEAHVTAQQTVHEQIIKEEQSDLSRKLESLNSEVSDMGTKVAVLSSQLKDYNLRIEHDRSEILELLKGLTKEKRNE